jgi:hypothetical protein
MYTGRMDPCERVLAIEHQQVHTQPNHHTKSPPDQEIDLPEEEPYPNEMLGWDGGSNI